MATNLFSPLSGVAAPSDANIRSAVVDPRLSRTSYYDGRLLKATDLVRDQQYFDVRLREVGRALGDGVVRGLELTLVDNDLGLSPGIAVTAAGRVLHLDREIRVDLGNRAQLQVLNATASGRLATGLYAVTLRLAEAARGVAEVFPTDLATRQRPRPDSIVEGVALDLIKLGTPLPRFDDGAAVQARAALAATLAGAAPPELPEDAVGLGVLAVRNDRLLWLDSYLLRHSPRSGDRHPQSEDLAEHYARLFADIREARSAAGLPELDWSALDYLDQLPPVGPVPKASFDPVAGRQAFFPANWSVHVAPIRDDDWPVLAREALSLEPLSLRSSAPAHVLVVARLRNDDFARYAPQLADDPADPNRFPVIDPLLLRFAPRVARAEDAIDADANAWANIWNAVQPGGVWFVRRAPRAAANPVVAVIANGVRRPPLPLPETPSPAIEWSELQPMLSARTTDESAAAAKTVLDAAATSSALESALLSLMLAADRRFDEVIWPTILELLEKARGETPPIIVPPVDRLTGPLPAPRAKKARAASARATDKDLAQGSGAVRRLAQHLANVPARGKLSEIQRGLNAALSKAGVEKEALLKRWLELADPQA